MLSWSETPRTDAESKYPRKVALGVAAAVVVVGFAVYRFPPAAEPPLDLGLLGWYDEIMEFRQSIRESNVRRRFLETMELFETAMALQRQNIRRRNPGLSEAEVDDRLQRWLLDRPETFTSSPDFRRSSRWCHLERS